MNRRWQVVAVAVPVLTLGVLVLRLATMEFAPEDQWEVLMTQSVATVAGLAVGAPVLVGIVLAARVIVGPAGPARVALPAVSIAATLGAIAAMPVWVHWHDGCNPHGGDVTLLAAPYVSLVEPRDSRLIYAHAQTLAGCLTDARFTR